MQATALDSYVWLIGFWEVHSSLYFKITDVRKERWVVDYRRTYLMHENATRKTDDFLQT